MRGGNFAKIHIDISEASCYNPHVNKFISLAKPSKGGDAKLEGPLPQ